MRTFLFSKQQAQSAGRPPRRGKPLPSDRAALVVLVVGTVGLLLTIGALNGGAPPAASAWDGIKTYLLGLLASTWVLVLALIALVVCVWQIAHGQGYRAVGNILGLLAVALIGPGVLTAAATATRSPVALQQPAARSASTTVVASPAIAQRT